MQQINFSGRVSRVVISAVLAGSLTACNGGGGGGGNSFGIEDICLSNFTGALGDLPIVAAAALDNLSPAQLTSLTNSIGSTLSLPIGGLGDLLAAVENGDASQEDANCALDNGLAGQGITDPSQLLPGDLANLLSVLDPSILTDLITGFDLANPLAGVSDLLSAVQDGLLSVPVVGELVLDGLTQLGDATAILGAPNLFADGLGGILNTLAAGLPGGLPSLTDADILNLANSLNDSDALGSLGPLQDVLAGITGGLSGDLGSQLTDTILGGLLAGSPDQFVAGLGDLLASLGSTLPGGLGALPAADVLALGEALDLANLQNSLAPLEDVLTGITSGFDPSVITSITDTVLGGLLMAAPDQFLPGFGDVLNDLAEQFPGGLDALPLGDILDLADAFNLADINQTLQPVQDVLNTLTAGIAGDAVVLVIDTVLGTVGGLLGLGDLFG